MTLCTKDPTAPATCALCGEDHPASYKGCVIYKNLQHARGKTHHPIHPSAIQTSPTPVTITDARQFPSLPRTLPPVPVPESPPTSYSRIFTHHQQPTTMTEKLSIFLHEFKTMFSQLIQQNNMILNMLSTVIHKLAN